ncbi:hypothetical protein GGX14DRAFT_405314 [Mycena pura]|uniref:Uncharacterized protein n=1 Tax=Mycena pura TaxID=153505 RepID=A0AAD6USL9_9AGAR|nr:hypothetical protein GGX14DRAFT_405314 [Mycena pura]
MVPQSVHVIRVHRLGVARATVLPISEPVNPGPRYRPRSRRARVPPLSRKLRTATDLAQPVRVLLQCGVAGYKFTHHIALLVARLAPHVLCSAEAFIVCLRAAALGMFGAHWYGDDGPWRRGARGACEYLTSHGVNLASLMGSLFRYGVLHVRDMYHCVRALLHAGASGFHQLQALHALVVDCRPDLCMRDASVTAGDILRAIRATGADGCLLWGPPMST